jgi:hypothetical protein
MTIPRRSPESGTDAAQNRPLWLCATPCILFLAIHRSPVGRVKGPNPYGVGEGLRALCFPALR